MNTKVVKQKGIHEDMTTMELASMVNNGFDGMMAYTNTQVDSLRKDIDNINVTLNALKTDYTRTSRNIEDMQEHLRFITKNIVTRYEHESLNNRVNTLETKLV